VTQLPFTKIGDSHELAEDARALFDDLAASLQHEQRAYSGECQPVLDVYESDAAVEIIVDVSGVPVEAIRVLFRSGVVLVAGEKAPAASSPAQTFHLVEREFGRFARAVRVNGAFDVEHARAMLDTAYAWLDGLMAARKWAGGDNFSLADCAAAPSLFYADWVHPIPEAFPKLRAYRARLLARPSFARAVDEARYFRPYFPGGAPDRD